MWDPFERGEFATGVRTVEVEDRTRRRRFPCEIWSPEGSGRYPLIVFSHSSGGRRTQSTFLCTHLASHGYVVAAMDHSETVVPELGRQAEETEEQRSARWDAVIAARVPDIRVLLDAMEARGEIERTRIGIAGHSFGGWTALAATEADHRIRSVVALAPAGASKRKPGILPVTLDFRWGRNVPALYLVAQNDTSLPIEGMHEIFERTPATKLMVVLDRADHLHFMDNVEQTHEAVRAMTGPMAALVAEMRPIGELCSGEQAHTFVRGLTLAHFDATLKGSGEARRFLESDLDGALRRRGVPARTVRA